MKPNSQWALSLVAKWCEKRTDQKKEKRLLKQCRYAYLRGPLVVPVKQYADALEEEITLKTKLWMELAKQMRNEIQRIEHQPDREFTNGTTTTNRV